MEDIYINHFAVVTAAVANLALGALWYSPLLFFKGWKNANNLTDADLQRAKPGLMYGGSVILSLVICYNMAFFLGDPETGWSWGATAGFLAGFGWAAMVFTIIALFEQRSVKYILINGGYIVVYFTLVGFILGIWR